MFWSWELSYVKEVKVLFPIEETIVRSIRTYSKLRPSLSSCLFYKPQLRCIANQSGSAKETVSPKIGKNVEMLVCFICVATWDRTLIDINHHYQVTMNQHKNLFNLPYSPCLVKSSNISHNNKIKIKNLKIKTVKINIKIEYKYIQSNIFTVSAAYFLKSFCHISF